MMPFKFLRVGPSDCKIVELKGEDREKCLGLFNRNDMTIGMLDSYASPQIEAQVFFHEMNHAIYEVMGIHVKDPEERVVDRFTTGLAMVMRDNPKLIQWLLKRLR
jgi:hypothetical protein